MSDSRKVPDLGCATATPLELKLLDAAKRYAAGDDAEKQQARADYAETLADYLRSSGQLTNADIIRPLLDR